MNRNPWKAVRAHRIAMLKQRVLLGPPLSLGDLRNPRPRHKPAISWEEFAQREVDALYHGYEHMSEEEFELVTAEVCVAIASLEAVAELFEFAKAEMDDLFERISR